MPRRVTGLTAFGGTSMSVRAGLLSTTMLAGVVGGVFMTVQVARAADIEPVKPAFKALPALIQPAVDGFNAKWDALGGTITGRSLYASRGSFSIPLATQWGLQIDVQAGSLERRACSRRASVLAQSFARADRHLHQSRPLGS